MELVWTSKPLDTATIRKGQKWEYTLPLEPAEGLRVDWRCEGIDTRFLKIDSDNPLTIELLVPAGADCSLFSIIAVVSDKSGASEEHAIQVRAQDSQPQQAPQPPKRPAVEQKPPYKPTNTQHQPPPPVPQPHTPAAPGGRVAVAVVQTPALAPDAGVPSVVQQPSASPAAAQPLRGRPYIEVADSSGKIFHDIRRAVEKHKSLLVGKESSSLARIPDINLKGRFTSKESESECSREQAKAYWSGNGVAFQNLGGNPAKLLASDGSASDAPGNPFDWQPGQTVIIPGGIRLTLRLDPMS